MDPGASIKSAPVTCSHRDIGDYPPENRRRATFKGGTRKAQDIEDYFLSNIKRALENFSPMRVKARYEIGITPQKKGKRTHIVGERSPLRQLFARSYVFVSKGT